MGDDGGNINLGRHVVFIVGVVNCRAPFLKHNSPVRASPVPALPQICCPQLLDQDGQSHVGGKCAGTPPGKFPGQAKAQSVGKGHREGLLVCSAVAG